MGRGPILKWLVCVSLLTSVASGAKPDSPPDVDAATVRALIAQLGDSSFQQRELAARELRSIGLPTFNLLIENRLAADLEVRSRVRGLLEELMPRMLRRDVPAYEAALVNDYVELSKENRRARLLLISRRLMPEFGCTILTRVAQLEEDPVMAKIAAAGLVYAGVPDDPATTALLHEQAKVLGGDAAGMRWIGEFRRSLDNPSKSIEAFGEFVDDERALLRTQPETTDQRDVIWPLRLYGIDLRVRANRQDEAESYVSELFGSTRPTSERTQIVAWLYERGFHDLLLALGEEYSDWFEDERYCQYLRAASALAAGEAELGVKLAERAFQAADDDDADRVQTALLLRRTSLNEWSEREYRAVIDADREPFRAEVFESRKYLADMLHRQLRDEEAAQVLKEAIELCENDETEQAIENLETNFSLQLLEVEMHHYLALCAGRKGKTAKQIEHFHQALANYASNSDVICDAYQVEDRSWRAELNDMKNDVLVELYSDMGEWELALANEARPAMAWQYRMRIAANCNEVAWILVNTGGNLEEALRLAKRSVQLRPGRGYAIDTLAVCHFAMGEVETAIALERQALRLLPYREDIMRTLEEFEAARSE